MSSRCNLNDTGDSIALPMTQFLLFIMSRENTVKCIILSNLELPIFAFPHFVNELGIRVEFRAFGLTTRYTCAILGDFSRQKESAKFCHNFTAEHYAFPRGAPTSTRARAERNTSAKIISAVQDHNTSSAVATAYVQFITHLLLICSFSRISLLDVFLRLCVSWHCDIEVREALIFNAVTNSTKFTQWKHGSSNWQSYFVLKN